MEVANGHVESLKEQISTLVRERQELRLLGASRRTLERNRIELARHQFELGRMLIEQRTASSERP